MNLSLEEEYQPTADILQEEKLLIGLSYQGGIVPLKCVPPLKPSDSLIFFFFLLILLFFF